MSSYSPRLSAPSALRYVGDHFVHPFSDSSMSHKKSSSVSLGSKKVPQEKLWNPETVVGWEDNSVHGQCASSSSSGSRVDGAHQVDEERAALLREKQSELDMIEDQHDNLVRVTVLCHCSALSMKEWRRRVCRWTNLTIHVGPRSISSGTVDNLGYIRP